MQEFKVNDYLKVRLENNSTIIVVDFRPFIQCKYLLLNLKIEEIESLDELPSVDELADDLNHSLEEGYENIVDIPPEVEFWAHCSNLQVWAENNYDTRLLHRNLAFPLLKTLADAGDPKAKQVFKEEIAKRIRSGNKSVITYLLNEFFSYLEEDQESELEYIFFLDIEELEFLLYDLEDNTREQIENMLYQKLIHPHAPPKVKEKCYEILKKIKKAVNLKFVEVNGVKYFVDSNGRLEISTPRDKKLENITDIIELKNLTNLKILNLSGNNIKKLSGLTNFKDLETLILTDNQLDEISGLERLINLRILGLERNKISKITGLENLVNLERLNLNQNHISDTEGLSSLKNLKQLYLDSNQIKKLSNLNSLQNLEVLHLINNKIEKIESINKLKLLKQLFLNHNAIKKIEGLSGLEKLQYLELSNNKIPKIEGLENLESLREIYIKNNPIPAEILEELGGLDFLGKAKQVMNFIRYCKKKLRNKSL
ncbi:MAG: leucine-rich repeat domain-containing protein [Candidatus Odinarchaeota archaeon]